MTHRRLLLAAGGLALLPPGLSARAACLSDEEVGRLAEALVSGNPIPAPAGMSMADAECTRDKLVPLLARHWGRPIGYKAGATGAATQRNFGLSGPVYGVMFESTVSLRDGAELALAPPVPNINVEADLLVRVRDEGVNTAGPDHVAILRHLEQVIPFIEMPRGGVSGRLDGPGLVASNVSARLGVVGTPLPARADAEFAARLGGMTVVFGDDTREIARAQGTALLDHPLNVIPWLVGDLARSGKRLQAGDIVSLGGFAPSVPAQAGRTYTLRYEGLAEQPINVSVRIR